MFRYETSAFFCTTASASYLTISAGSKTLNSGIKTSMYLPDLRFQVLFCVLVFLFATPLAARDIEQNNWVETKDKWGQVLFCQIIYTMPEVKSRLYDFDVRQCEKASKMMTDVIATYSKQDQVQLKALAEQHAYRLSRFTSEPYQSVPACRELCREMTATGDPSSE